MRSSIISYHRAEKDHRYRARDHDRVISQMGMTGARELQAQEIKEPSK